MTECYKPQPNAPSATSTPQSTPQTPNQFQNLVTKILLITFKLVTSIVLGGTLWAIILEMTPVGRQYLEPDSPETPGMALANLILGTVWFGLSLLVYLILSAFM